MTTGRISKRSVDALSCPDGKDRGILWDDDLAGFGVIAFPSGAKTYIKEKLIAAFGGRKPSGNDLQAFNTDKTANHTAVR